MGPCPLPRKAVGTVFTPLRNRFLARVTAGPVALALGVVLCAGLLAAITTTPAQGHASVVLEAAPTSLPADRNDLRAASRQRAVDAGPPVSSAPPAVAPLTSLRVPDLQITLPVSLTAAQNVALRGVAGLTALAVLDQATVTIGTASVQLAGVDPSELRALTPRDTAASDPLWAAVARGELAASYALVKQQQLPLGGPVMIGQAPRRLGAVAALGLPGIEVITDHATAFALGAAPARVLLLAAPSRRISSLKAAVSDIVGPAAQVTVLRAPPLSRHRPSNYRELYIASAAYCPGLRWQVLASIGQIESGHGRNVGPSTAGALGPMQFLPSTWAAYGVDGDGDGKADVLNPYDAVPSAALYLCRNGAGAGGQSLYDAIYAYNHADWYVQEVLALADRYR